MQIIIINKCVGIALQYDENTTQTLNYKINSCYEHMVIINIIIGH